MKINNKILALLIVFIAIVSVSAVSAEDIAADDVVAAPIDDVAVVEASAEADEVLSATHEIPADATVSDIQTIINQTSAGDTLSFAANATYDFGNISKGIEITHTLILEGNGATIQGYQGFAISGDEESVDNTEVHDLNFIMTQDPLWNGRALEFGAGDAYVIDGCTFTNGNSGIYIRNGKGSTNKITITNCEFYGDDGATNHSSIGKDKETGMKAINIMGGSGIIVSDNIFEGDMLDAVSIASGASNVEMYNNLVNDVWYGVFYGGGITNITVQDNIFSDNKVYALGVVKAGGTSDFSGNNFKTPENASAIYVEEGNTAHGAPSNIETILIHENTFTGEGSTAVSASSKGGMITPLGEFTVVDNIYEPDIVVFEFTDNNTYSFATDHFVVPDKNVTIEANIPILESEIRFINEKVEYKFGDDFGIMLIDLNDVILAEADVEIKIFDDNNQTVLETNVTTDEQGMINVPLILTPGEYTITVGYNGEEIIGNAFYTGTFDFTSVNIITNPVIISGKNVTIPTKAKQRFEIMLKDDENKLLTNQTVQFTINGVTYNRTTDENGIAGLNINLNMGEYPITVNYTAGNTTFSETYTLTAIQSNTTIKSTPVEFKGKGNKFEAQLVDQLGQPIADHIVAFHINGVAYYKVTDADGKVYLNINLEPGVYNMYMSFDGTFQYAASNGGSQVTVV